MPKIRILKNYYYTVRRLSFQQIYHRIRTLFRYRIYYRLRYKMFGEPKVRWSRSDTFLDGYRGITEHRKLDIRRYYRSLQDDDYAASLQNADEIMHGQFRFMQYAAVTLEDPIDWTADPYGKKLWRYNLHYFDFGVSLAKAFVFTGDERYKGRFVRLVSDWIEHNRYGVSEGWERYAVAKRLLNWVEAIRIFDETGSLLKDNPSILASIWLHADFMLKNLEYDALYNHLLINGRALYATGSVLPSMPDAKRFRDKGLTIIRRSLKQEVLPDGGYAERSPSYHLLVLIDFFECMMLAEDIGEPFDPWMNETILKMTEHMAGLMKPDRTLPMLNDACRDFPMNPAKFLAAATVRFQRPDFASLAGEPSQYLLWHFAHSGLDRYQKLECKWPDFTTKSYPDTGYFVIRTGWERDDTYLVFDCGPIGPSKQLAHAHADTLSFELAANGQTLIADPGIYEYEAGPWRDYFRSTAAHNTVTVDGQNQSFVWKSFRVAEMANAYLQLFDETKEYIIIKGSQDGYRRLDAPVIHTREIRYERGKHTFILTDTLSGSGNHHILLSFQLPAIHLEQVSDEQFWAFYENGTKVHWQAEHPAGTEFRVQPSWISYHWGEKQPIHAAQWSWNGRLPVQFKTTISIRKGDSR